VKEVISIESITEKDLKPGEFLCPMCHGNKSMCYMEKGFYHPVICTRCDGEGKLDWIEMVVGKKKLPKITPYNYYDVYGVINKRSFLSINVTA
jgi:hypothetical protein